MNHKVKIIVQARMGSTRLPNKALLKIGDKPMLQHVVNQIKKSKYVDEIIIATTTSKKDEKIVTFCKKNNLNYFRGSNQNVLNRYYHCSKKYSCDPVVRISSDCPFIDPYVIDKTVEIFFAKSYDYVSNNIEKIKNKWENSICNFPQGMVIEICNFRSLEKAWKNARKPSEKEHVFPYVQFTPSKFKIFSFSHESDLSYIRCTVDKKQDLKFVREVWRRIPKSKKIIHISDIEKIIKKEPHLIEINNSIKYDEGYLKSVEKDIQHAKKNNKQ